MQLTFATKWSAIMFLTCHNLLLPSCHGSRSDKHDSSDSFRKKNRDHIAETLKLNDNFETQEQERLSSEILGKLAEVYKDGIKPLEDQYKFRTISHRAVNDREIHAPPRLLLIGPWSTGKTSFINYILNIENENYALFSGPQPTTSDFTILMHGDEYKHIEGFTLVSDDSYSSLEKFGQSFLERLEGIKLPKKLLKMVTLVDTPGILENRKQQERGYPFIDVCHWFVDRADLIFLVFDPTKLDAGLELEMLFKQLRGHESRVRIILNKADSVEFDELMRVYGALFWALAPLINVTEPPRVYIGSFWSKATKTQIFSDLFRNEEILLFQDLRDIIVNRVEYKIGLVRQHGVRVRNHALIVDKYLEAFTSEKPVLSFIRDTSPTLESIINKPFNYRIYDAVLRALEQISSYDLPPFEEYVKFFTIHALDSFQPISSSCSYWFKTCYLDKINEAIDIRLTGLLHEFKHKMGVKRNRNEL